MAPRPQVISLTEGIIAGSLGWDGATLSGQGDYGGNEQADLAGGCFQCQVTTSPLLCLTQQVGLQVRLASRVDTVQS